jgi:pimeloyl-ACP methyl ester carboxylesterase
LIPLARFVTVPAAVPHSHAPVRSVYRAPSGTAHPYHWLEAGRHHDETIVLLHGLMAHSMAYRKVVARLATNYRVIVPDLPAHGRDHSFRAEPRPQVTAMVDWLEGLLSTIDAERVHLVGHSLGATLSYLAAREPRRFAMLDSLTLVSPGLKLSVPPWAPHLLRRLPRTLPGSLTRLGVNRVGMRIFEPIQWRQARMNETEMEDYLNPIRDPERLAFMLALSQDLILEPDRLAGADTITLPTLVIWGEKDHLLPVDTAFALQARLRNGQLRVFKNCGHSPMEDCPQDFVNALAGFLPTP